MYIWRKRPKVKDRTRSRRHRAALRSKDRARKTRASGRPY